MIVLGLILAVLVVGGLLVAFAAVTMFWILMAVFWVSVAALALVVQDPYLGFFLAFPVTGLVIWRFVLSTKRSPAN